MKTFEINTQDEQQLTSGVIFNTILTQNPKIIKKLIKLKKPFYRIENSFLEIINPYMDIKKDGTVIYTGLIIRTSYENFLVLYFEELEIDEEYMLMILKNYLKDEGTAFDEVIVDYLSFDRKIMQRFL